MLDIFAWEHSKPIGWYKTADSDRPRAFASVVALYNLVLNWKNPELSTSFESCSLLYRIQVFLFYAIVVGYYCHKEKPSG